MKGRRNEGKKKIYGKTSWSEDCRQKCCYLGGGSFGKVYRGLYGDDEKKIQVAVKRTEIKLEADIHKILGSKKPQHKNIVQYFSCHEEEETDEYTLYDDSFFVNYNINNIKAF